MLSNSTRAAKRRSSRLKFTSRQGRDHSDFCSLTSVSGRPITLRFSKSKVYLLKDRNLVGLSASRSMGLSK